MSEHKRRDLEDDLYNHFRNVFVPPEQRSHKDAIKDAVEKLDKAWNPEKELKGGGEKDYWRDGSDDGWD